MTRLLAAWASAVAALLAATATAQTAVTGTGTGTSYSCTGGSTADTAISTAINSGVAGNSAAAKSQEAAAIAEIPDATGKFVTGFIAAYFNRVTLEPGEKSCIIQNICVLSKDASGVLTLAGTTIEKLVDKEEPNALEIISGLSRVIELTTTVQHLVRGCIRADSIAVMNQTFAHLENPNYIEGRFMANGIDIARVFADSIPAYEAGNFGKVGKDFGTLLRKILLSRNSGVVEMVLPEGMPKEAVGEAIMDGVVDGLFVSGTTVDIRNTKDSTINIHIDMHKCFAKEAKFFSTAANAIYLTIASITTNVEQWQLHQKGIQTGYNAEGSNYGQNAPIDNGGVPAGMNLDWLNQLSGVMMNVPVLLARCGFTVEQEKMMKKAIKEMQTTSMTFRIPGPKNRQQAGDLAAVKFAEAAEEWKVGHYKDFGFLLGGLMRDLLLTIFPQKYHVDEHGLLREYVDSKRQRPLGSFTLVVAGFSVSMLVGLSIIRAVRCNSGSKSQSSFLLTEADATPDVEGLNVESVE